MEGISASSISNMLRLPAATRSSTAGGDSFAAQLESSFADHAARLGLKMPAPTESAAGTPIDGESVDVIWQRAQAMSSAGGGGLADSIMDGLDAASERRAEQRHGRGSSFDMFTI